jgi:hypothetical protein
MFRPVRITAYYNNRPRLARRGASALALLIATGATLLGVAGSSAATRTAVAYAARTLNGTATAHLHLVRAEGSELIEEGSVSGALVGTAHAQLITGATFAASFTIHTRGGSITGRGHATPHGSGRYQSFSGSFDATNGTGRYAHISGRAGLYGVFDRRTDSVVIQTTGTLTY